ncbi:unnamed protein product [Rotaria magnacalcarata]|uniref:F-box domain-containing protein n=1 Tax=Rotaria magnacalcarata TaxID=392030 RepID=A0A816S745_9BILA|nr:unnamed protein product [Rotaria magnacalcarata]CAF4599289.1 unnamed protein product [Rotaria magnacalcarata]
MPGSSVELNDFSDEILPLIFKKLEKAEVLYSFLGVNQRFTRLVHDSVFTNRLTLTKGVADGLFDRLDNQKRERFRLQILPSIRHKIEWLGAQGEANGDRTRSERTKNG